jgi:Asp-tRNA(Asn)/Glu-tRNA(Gln) amidotransferase A subunit family amidase
VSRPPSAAGPDRLLSSWWQSQCARRSRANSIAGQDPEDATSLSTAPPCLFVDGPRWSLSPLEEPLQKHDQSGDRPLRIGLDRVYNSEGVDPELTASVEAAAKVLAEAVGGEIVPVELPAGEELQRMIDGACAPSCNI